MPECAEFGEWCYIQRRRIRDRLDRALERVERARRESRQTAHDAPMVAGFVTSVRFRHVSGHLMVADGKNPCDGELT